MTLEEKIKLASALASEVDGYGAGIYVSYGPTEGFTVSVYDRALECTDKHLESALDATLTKLTARARAERDRRQFEAERITELLAKASS